MARMPKISKENLDKFRVVRDEHTRKYLETVPSAVLEAAGLYMEASTGRWLYRASKNLPRVLETLRQGTPPAVKPSTPSISSRHQNAAVMDWDAESGSFKPEPMKPKRSPGRTTGTVPRKKKQQESDRNKAKVQKRKNKRGMY
tara:strand:+ start:1000 stop:1428 length:429 start_codon:yes stop_codon:yes gene_type:complete